MIWRELGDLNWILPSRRIWIGRIPLYSVRVFTLPVELSRYSNSLPIPKYIHLKFHLQLPPTLSTPSLFKYMSHWISREGKLMTFFPPFFSFPNLSVPFINCRVVSFPNPLYFLFLKSLLVNSTCSFDSLTSTVNPFFFPFLKIFQILPRLPLLVRIKTPKRPWNPSTPLPSPSPLLQEKGLLVI